MAMRGFGVGQWLFIDDCFRDKLGCFDAETNSGYAGLTWVSTIGGRYKRFS